MRTLALCLATIACGCGARTDLERGEPEETDAYVLDTFPCRWAFGGTSIEIARGMVITDLTGAVDRDRDLALVAAMRGGEIMGALVPLAQVPFVRAPFDGPSGRLFSGDSGFLRQEGTSCALAGLDLELVTTGLDVEWDIASCALSQSESGRIESVSMFETRASLDALTVRGATSTVDHISDLGGALIEAVVVRDDEEYYVGTLDRSGTVLLRSLANDEPARVDRGGVLSGAPDRLRGGAVFLYDSESGWQLVRLHTSMPGTVGSVADLSALRAPPIGRVVTNETEALVPLADGSVVYVALNRSLIRSTDPVPEGAVESMEIVIRPGTSAAAALYVVASETGERRLMYRGLVCNR